MKTHHVVRTMSHLSVDRPLGRLARLSDVVAQCPGVRQELALHGADLARAPSYLVDACRHLSIVAVDARLQTDRQFRDRGFLVVAVFERRAQQTDVLPAPEAVQFDPLVGVFLAVAGARLQQQVPLQLRSEFFHLVSAAPPPPVRRAASLAQLLIAVHAVLRRRRRISTSGRRRRLVVQAHLTRLPVAGLPPSRGRSRAGDASVVQQTLDKEIVRQPDHAGGRDLERLPTHGTLDGVPRGPQALAVVVDALETERVEARQRSRVVERVETNRTSRQRYGDRHLLGLVRRCKRSQDFSQFYTVVF